MKITQYMNLPNGLRKGMATVLFERGAINELEKTSLNADCKKCKAEKKRGNAERYSACERKRCCLRKILSLQPDFLAQKTQLEEVTYSSTDFQFLGHASFAAG